MQLRELLVVPSVAGLLGFFVGVALISAMAWSRKLSSSADARDGIIVMMVAMLGGMLVASGVLIAYVFAARAGFVYFGLSLAAGFVIGLGVITAVLMRDSFRD